MEIIRGKHASFIDTPALAHLLNGYEQVHIDIGTGDGRFARHIAQARPTHFVIGIDACRENLYDVSRRAPANALFVIANALALPTELYGLADGITINFPWGSLLEGLLANDTELMRGVSAVCRPKAKVEIRLNGGALAEAGWPLEAGAYRVRDVLADNGFEVGTPTPLSAHALKSFPTTWAKRLAYGRDPHAMYLRGIHKAARYTAQPAYEWTPFLIR